MEKTIDFCKPERKSFGKSYVHLEIRLSGKAVMLSLGAVGTASGLSFLLKYLVSRYAHKSMYGRLPEEERCSFLKNKKKPMGFTCEPVQSEDSD